MEEGPLHPRNCNKKKQDEEIKIVCVPKALEGVAEAAELPSERHRWNTNEEVASILIAFQKHERWQSKEVKHYPRSGSMLLYSRSVVRYRNDGYSWKKRRDGRTAREDHMKLKVQGVECIYGKYCHSAILPTFHRRCYGLLGNPDIVVVHYLNVPLSDDNKWPSPTLPVTVKPQEWTRDQLLAQVKPMFYTSANLNSDQAVETEETVDSIVKQLLSQQTTTKLLQHQLQQPLLINDRPKQPSVIPQGASLGGSSVLAVSTVPSSSSGPQSVTRPSPDGPSLAGTPVIFNLAQLQNGNGFVIFSGQTLQIPMTTMAANDLNPVTTQVTTVTTQHQNIVRAPKTLPSVVKSKSGANCDIQHAGNQSNQQMTGNQSINFQSVVLPVSSNCYLTGSRQSPLYSSSVMSQDQMVAAAVNGGVTTQDVLLASSRNEPNIGHHNSPYSHSILTHEMSPPVTNVSSTDTFMELTQSEINDALSTSLPTCSVSLDKTIEGLQQGHNSPNIGELNIDAFDFLDLGDLESDLLSSPPENTSLCNTDKNNHAGIANITDFSPDWSYPEGGCKVLISGPWYSTSSPYSCVFDGVSVTATLVQSGVLRCVCPAHAPGIVTFQVACEGYVISNTCSFDYRIHERTKPSPELKDWIIADDKEFKLALLDKLSEIEKCLVKPNSTTNLQISKPLATIIDAFEQHCIDYCIECSLRAWLPLHHVPISSDFKGMTLLHLAAALGYSNLTQTLIKWRSESPSIVLEYEVDALSLDSNSSTPFAWACGLNKTEAATVLYKWNKSATNVCLSDGVMPLDLALSRGYTLLVNRINALQRQKSPDLTKGFGFRKYTDGSELLTMDLPSFANLSTIASPSKGAMLSSAPSSPRVMTPPTTFSGNFFDSDKNVQIETDCASLLLSAKPSSSKSKSSTSVKSKRAERLRKRLSVEILPCNSKTASESTSQNLEMPLRCLRSASSDSHLLSLVDPSSGDNQLLTMNEDNDFSVISFMQTESQQLASKDTEMKHSAMDTDRSESPIIDVERISSDEDDTGVPSKNQMVTLAKQIIAAMPERIKLSPSRSDDSGIVRDRSSSYGSLGSSFDAAQSVLDDSGISTPLGAENLSFDEYRYNPDIGTPASSMSPDSSCLQSPLSFLLDSPTPTMSEFQEYFNAPSTYMEKDFSQLTLSDHEQRRLYEAAKIIQNFYRQYKDRQQQQNQRIKEIEAAILIQSYYRRYKQYAYYKRMCQAAVLIQSQFRSYRVQKKFKRSRDAATVIQNQYRAYKEHERFKKSRDAAKIIQQRFRYRSHYQRKQSGQDVPRSVQNLMRQSVDSYCSTYELYSRIRPPPVWQSTETEQNENESNDRAATPANESTPAAAVAPQNNASDTPSSGA